MAPRASKLWRIYKELLRLINFLIAGLRCTFGQKKFGRGVPDRVGHSLGREHGNSTIVQPTFRVASSAVQMQKDGQVFKTAADEYTTLDRDVFGSFGATRHNTQEDCRML